MQGIRVIRSNLSCVVFRVCTHLSSAYIKSFQYTNPINETTLFKPVNDFRFALQFSCFSTSNLKTPIPPNISKLEEKDLDESDSETDNCHDYDDKEVIDVTDNRQLNISDESVVKDVKSLVDILREFGDKCSEMKAKIEQCSIRMSSELVVEVLSQVRNDWEAAFTFFLWAGKQPGYAHSTRQYNAMISILGKMRKFDTAWALIDEMRGGRNGPSFVTKQTLLIMIRRYCAVHDVGRAINAFYAYKKFKFDVDMDDFQSLLSGLCRYKNVQEAEHLMFCNKEVFPLNAKSFNIILNGWCNIIGSPREADRVWREMSRRGIYYDVVSFSSIMSCYSKVNNLHKVLRLFDQMKKWGIEPDRKVYNAVIHALAKVRFVREAINLMKTMEEKGIAPNVVTYNSLIKPLCKARKINEAREVLDDMLQRGLKPTIQTYHAFLRILRTGEEVFELLESMRKMGCQPDNDTYIMLIRKFSRWCQFDNVFKVWDEMSDSGIGHDRSSYVVLIHGLFLNGKLEEAHKYYVEMKGKQFLPEPKTDEMIQDWLSNKQFAERQVAEFKANNLQSGKHMGITYRRSDEDRNFLRRPETRRVVRERGFSFWEH
ncbi:pentatricopeptide repeat-containing protein At5g15010, mitochondrial-like [Mangifera indica]|uniref:pentatricopeptide repeat-containing protein At5g15010, mitochondrial-like n=1 Tax=Mangifera indica TaxID=29780 RepID=UPI001CFAD0D7|nr:pentatricopeptide repeat-containing protein At5g15010, mitochondrial-like [Mangifera indica]